MMLPVHVFVKNQHPVPPVSRWRELVEQGLKRRRNIRHQRHDKVESLLRQWSQAEVRRRLPAGPGPLRPPPSGGLPVGGAEAPGPEPGRRSPTWRASSRLDEFPGPCPSRSSTRSPAARRTCPRLPGRGKARKRCCGQALLVPAAFRCRAHRCSGLANQAAEAAIGSWMGRARVQALAGSFLSGNSQVGEFVRHRRSVGPGRGLVSIAEVTSPGRKAHGVEGFLGDVVGEQLLPPQQGFSSLITVAIPSSG